MKGALVADNLGKRFGVTRVLEHISFCLPERASLAVIGPSGCGKSTLLSIAGGLMSASEGRVCRPEDRYTAVILQDYGLFPWKTVRGNLSLPLQIGGFSRTEQSEAVSSMLAELGLTGLEKRYPAQLSGGQRQRVAIGRALIVRPGLLLMDEPFAALDPLTREHLQLLLLDIWKRRSMSFMLVTHNLNEAVLLGQFILVLGGRPSSTRLWLENPCFGQVPNEENACLYAEVIKQIRRAQEQPGGQM